MMYYDYLCDTSTVYLYLLNISATSGSIFSNKRWGWTNLFYERIHDKSLIYLDLYC